VFGIILPPPSYNLKKLVQVGETVEEELRPYWDVDPESPEAEELQVPPIGDFFYVARGRQVFMGLRAADPLRAGELVPLAFQLREKLPGAIVVAAQSSLFEQGLTANRAIDIEITGPDLEQLAGIGGRILGAIMNPETTPVPRAQARPIPSLDLGGAEMHVVPKLVQAADLGISAADLGYTVDALIDGAYATDYYIGADKIDLVIVGNEKDEDTTGDQGDEQYKGHTQDLQGLPIATPRGVVPIAAVADVILTAGPEQINHRERQRTITIQVSPPPDIALEDAIQRIQTQILEPMRQQGALSGVVINLSGTADKLLQTWLALRWNVVLALLITYLLMAALFESWVYPLVVIVSVPLGAVGGVLGLHALNLYLWVQPHLGLQAKAPPPQTLDVLTMLGFVILIGTVVNNAILIVHQSLNHMRDEGYEPGDAILESVRSRIRPIFMTTATTVFGLLPLVLFPGAGSELYRGLGSVVLGGLAVSTIFTLVLVPTLFSLLMDAFGRRGLARRAEPSAEREVPNGDEPFAEEETLSGAAEEAETRVRRNVTTYQDAFADEASDP